VVRILIVDDELRLARNIAAYLRTFGDQFRVLISGSGEEAVRLLSEQPVDLLLTDVRLPGIDGIEVVRQAFEILPEIKVIVMTAFGSPDVRQAATRSGAFRFVEKPLDLGELKRLIEEARPGQGGWSGLVGGLDIFDVAQLLNLSGKSKAIRVAHGKDQGVLVFESGSLVHASTGELGGDAAFYRMTGWGGGAFEEMPRDDATSYPTNVSVSTTHLMMEAARLRDEAQRSDLGGGAAVASVPETAVENEPDHRLSTQEREMAVKDHLNELASVEGFLGAAVYSSAGDILEGISAGSLDIKTIGMFANNALLNAQKATDAMGVGRGNQIQIRAPKAHIVMRCLNEATDFAATSAGKAHFHTVVVMNPEGNVGMATMILEKVVGKIAEEMR